MAEIENLKIDGGATYTVGNEDIIANEWEASKTYVKGKSYVTYEHGLYVCNTTHTSVSPIDLTKWTAITIGEAIAANTTDIGNLSTLTTTDKSSIVGAVNEVNGAVGAIIHPTKIWSGSKYTLNDYIDIPDFDKNTMYMFEFMAFSGTYHTAFISAVGDGYLQFVIWGDNTQHCRYRIQINTNSGRLTIVDVTNGGANQALIALYAFT